MDDERVDNEDVEAEAADESWDDPSHEGYEDDVDSEVVESGRTLPLRRIVDIAIVVGAIAGVVALIVWRNDGLDGFGLGARYFADAAGKRALGDARERTADFDRLASVHARTAKLVRLRGAVVAPRSGRYLFGTESRGASTLSIDGKVIVENTGRHARSASQRLEPTRISGPPRQSRALLLERGAHDIELTYKPSSDPFFRALWTPARRWGGLEPIPASVLLPRSAKGADTSRASPVGPDDAAAALLILALLLVAALVLLRRPIGALLRDIRARREARLDLLLFCLVFGLALAARLWDLSAAGQTWDEDVYWTAGRSFVLNLLDTDLRADVWGANLEHPALAKWLYGFAALLSEDLEPARVVSALLSALTAGLLVLVGRDLFGRWVGLVAGTLCVAMPHVVAHGRIVGLESPSALLYMLAVWVFFRALRRGGNTKLYLLAGLFAGAAMATRFLNGSVLLAMLTMYVVVQRQTLVEERRLPMPLNLALLPLVALGVVVGTWPYLWDDTAAHIARSLAHWSQTTAPEAFLGERQQAPFYYLPVYFAVTMPAAALVACALGLLRAAVTRTFSKITLLLWILAPFVAMLSPVVRDGVRYIYPALIPACLLAAAGVDWVARGVAGALHRRTLRAPLSAGFGAAMLIYLVYCGFSVHPYALDYYNELVGGPARVARRRLFEIGWWGEGLGEAAAFIDRTARRGATVAVMADPSHVFRLRSDLVKVHVSKRPDYIIYNNLLNGPFRQPGYRKAYVVEADAAPLCWVYARDSAKPRADHTP